MLGKQQASHKPVAVYTQAKLATGVYTHPSMQYRYIPLSPNASHVVKPALCAATEWLPE